MRVYVNGKREGGWIVETGSVNKKEGGMHGEPEMVEIGEREYSGRCGFGRDHCVRRH